MFKIINGGVCAPKGFSANGIHCGIRKNRTKRDIALILSDVPAAAAATYTTNLVKGAPLTVTKKGFCLLFSFLSEKNFQKPCTHRSIGRTIFYEILNIMPKISRCPSGTPGFA